MRLVALLGLLGTGLVTPASADELNQDQALALHQQGVIVSLEALLQIAYQRHPGAKLLEAELEQDDGELIYELELLTADGKVRELEFDARNARLLKDEED